MKPLAGKEAEQARHLSQAWPLAEPTLAVARIEALRELKASSQAVSIRLNELRQTREGDPLHHALFMNIQRHITPKPEGLERMAPALHRQVEDAAQAPAKVGNGQAQLDRFSHAIDRAALMYAGQDQQLTMLPPIPAVEPAGRKTSASEEQQKAPEPKRRGLNL